jgi:hypothetical protein
MVSADRGVSAESRPVIFEYISALLGSAQSYSVLLIERAVVGLLRLCLLVSETVSRAQDHGLTRSHRSGTSCTWLWTCCDHSHRARSTRYRSSSWRAWQGS